MESAVRPATIANMNWQAAQTDLTPSELRLLPLPESMLSLNEIAACLEIRRSDVLSDAISLYAKLGVGSSPRRIRSIP